MILRVAGFLSCAVLASACLIDRSSVASDGSDAGTADMPDAPAILDAYAAPGVDAALDAAAIMEADAFLVGADAWAPDAWAPDAWAPDAFVLPDAFVPPDAVIVPICVPETCNGRDDDCNGTVDDGACGVDTTSGSRSICQAITRGRRAYLFCTPVATWDLARTLCRGFAGGAYDLVTFDDGAEQDALRPSLDRTVWLGLSDDPARIAAASDGSYRWLDGSTPSFFAWASGEPSTREVAGCVRLQTSGQWDAVSCNDTSNTNAFVCETAVP